MVLGRPPKVGRIVHAGMEALALLFGGPRRPGVPILRSDLLQPSHNQESQAKTYADSPHRETHPCQRFGIRRRVRT
jgi:hypothetical protein